MRQSLDARQGAMSFLDLPERPSKPRRVGVTIIRDEGMTLGQVTDVVTTHGRLFDYVKIKQWQLWYMPTELVAEKVRVYQAADVRALPGGTVFEVAYLQGKLDTALNEAQQIGFQAIELSENFIELSMDEWERVIGGACAYGLEVLFEYGPKYLAALPSVGDVVTAVHGLLSSGASRVILERSVLDLIFAQSIEEASAYLKAVASSLPPGSLVFEAEEFVHQVRLLKELGADVNLGPNLSAWDVVNRLEPARCGLGRAEGYSIIRSLGVK